MLKKLKPNVGLKSFIFLAVFVVLLAADLVTKVLEEEFAWNAVIIPGFIEIKSGVRNSGCAFSFLSNNPEVGQPIFISFTLLMLVGLIFVFVFLPERFKILKLSITIVVAGATGNLVDRFIFLSADGWTPGGGVRDWFGLNMFGNITYCNLADFWIVIGAALAIVDLLFLNEWALLPLTKSAKAAQAAKKEQEAREDAAEKASAEINSPKVDTKEEKEDEET